MSKDLALCRAKLRTLQQDIRELTFASDQANRQPLLLLARQSLQDLLAHMRGQQQGLKQKMSRSTHAAHAHNAYSSSLQLQKKK